jgi:copper homeostasis protein
MVEVVCYHAEAVKIAIEAEANRIELCSAPMEGGLTPSPGLVIAAKKICGAIPIHAMLRCREGNFVYTDAEKELMLYDLKWLASSGVAGIVCGALKENHDLDIDFLANIKINAQDLNLVFHRAIDVCTNPAKALEILIELGYSTILTSGSATKAMDGIETILQLNQQAKGRIEIMAGAGVNAKNIQEIKSKTGIQQIHLSAINPKMLEGFQEGIQSFERASPYLPDPAELKKCIALFNAI